MTSDKLKGKESLERDLNLEVLKLVLTVARISAPRFPVVVLGKLTEKTAGALSKVMNPPEMDKKVK